MTFIPNNDIKHCFMSCDVHTVARGGCSCKNRGLTITVLKTKTEYKLIKPLSPSGKMEVTPEQSEVLQEKLSDMGYGWSGLVRYKIHKTSKPYLFWDEYDKSISYSGNRLHFEKDNDYNIVQIFTDHFEPITNQQQP